MRFDIRDKQKQHFLKNVDRLVGSGIFLLYRYSIQTGICPDILVLESGYQVCNSTRGLGDYFWPLRHFSWALIIVGVLVIIRPNLFWPIAIWTGVAAAAIFVGVMSAPSIDSDLLLPIEKKGVGETLAITYLVVSILYFLWDIFKKK